MINECLNTIAEVLKGEFGYKIYVDNVEQGFIAPAFYIKCIDFDRNRLLTSERMGKHYKSYLSFAVTYFPKDTDKFREDFNLKIIKLLDLLENVKGQHFNLILENNSFNISDGALIMVMEFRVTSFYAKRGIKMEKLHKEVY